MRIALYGLLVASGAILVSCAGGGPAFDPIQTDDPGASQGTTHIDLRTEGIRMRAWMGREADTERLTLRRVDGSVVAEYQVTGVRAFEGQRVRIPMSESVVDVAEAATSIAPEVAQVLGRIYGVMPASPMPREE